MKRFAERHHIRILAIIAGVAAIVIALVLLWLPLQKTDLQQLLSGALLGVGVTVIVEEFLSVPERRAQERQYSELIAPELNRRRTAVVSGVEFFESQRTDSGFIEMFQSKRDELRDYYDPGVAAGFNLGFKLSAMKNVGDTIPPEIGKSLTLSVVSSLEDFGVDKLVRHYVEANLLKWVGYGRPTPSTDLLFDLLVMYLENFKIDKPVVLQELSDFFRQGLSVDDSRFLQHAQPLFEKLNAAAAPNLT